MTEQKGTEARVVAVSPIFTEVLTGEDTSPTLSELPQWSGLSLEHSVASYDWLKIHGFGNGSLYISLWADAGLWNQISWDSPHDSIAFHPAPLPWYCSHKLQLVTDLQTIGFKIKCIKMLSRCYAIVRPQGGGLLSDSFYLIYLQV